MTIKKYDFDFSFPSKVQRISPKKIKNLRNFPGSWTNRGFGPVNAPLVTNGGDSGNGGSQGGFTAGYGTGADPVSLGESCNYDNFINYGKSNNGPIMLEQKSQKFVAFLESLKDDSNKETIEIVKTGFEACLEAKKKMWSGKVTKEVKKAEKPEAGTFTKKAGAIVAELMSKSEGNPGTAVRKINFYINRAGDKLENKVEVMKAKKILETKNDKKKEAKKD